MRSKRFQEYLRKGCYLWLFSFVLISCARNKKEKGISNGLEHTSQTNPFDIDSLIIEPLIFYPDNVSTAIDKYNTSFSPNYNTIYYTATSMKLGVTGIAKQTFNGKDFDSPKFIPFTDFGVAFSDVQISKDGKTMFFSTYKDYPNKPEGFQFNIWTSKNDNGIWQNPEPINGKITSVGNEFYPVPTKDGSLYFTSDINGNMDIYFSRNVDGIYQKPIRLPDNINSPNTEADAFISPDENYLIFVRVDESDGLGMSDLYISFRIGDNDWTNPKNMGPQINSNQIDGSPYVTTDGKYLVFTSGRIPKSTKEAATKNYTSFKKIATSKDNGSLNFYFLSFDSNKYR